jgi:parvulin-like peptidyl-prolyl isomerase
MKRISLIAAFVLASASVLNAQSYYQNNKNSEMFHHTERGEAFRKEIEKGARVNKLVEQACSSVPEPTEEEVSAYYEAHKEDFVSPPEVLCQHILVKSEEGDIPEAKSAAFEKIRAIRERVVAGADFAEEAKANSDCPSGAEGGSLGWFGRGMMVPEFDKAAFEMKKGETSDIVTTQFGYHIIYKADERGGEAKTLVDVHDQLKDLLRHEARGRAMDAFVSELRENAQIEYR